MKDKYYVCYEESDGGFYNKEIEKVLDADSEADARSIIMGDGTYEIKIFNVHIIK